MRYLFEPAVQLMNRLKYGYKFGTIGLLIVLQAAVLISMLVSGMNESIDFAARERLGVRYTQVLAELLDAAQEYRTIHYAFSRGDHSLQRALLEKQAKVDVALAAVEEIDQLLGAQMDSAWKLDVLKREWVDSKQEAFKFGSERALVAFDLDSLWISEIIDLMQHAGNSSNLALDAGLDTSYLVDSVLRKLPGLVDTLGKAQGLAVQLADGQNLSAQDKDRLLLVAGLVRSGLEQTNRNAQMVFRHNESVKSKLKNLNDAVADSVPIFVWNFEQKTVGAQGAAIPQPLLTTAGNQAIQNALTLYKEELNATEELLDKRVASYAHKRNAVILFTGGILLLVCYLFLGFDISVRKGVYQLNGLMESAGKGDLGVRSDIYSRDEMGSLTRGINSMLDSLQKMYDEVRLSRDRLELWNQQLEQKVAERTASLRNLLDHAGQGFLSFGEDLKVAGEYSSECVMIFNREIFGESISGLFYPENRDQQVFLEAVLQKIFQEQDEFLRETYFSLLPAEIVLDNSYIGVAYKMIAHPAGLNRWEIMLILTDKTHQKAMEDRMQEERNILSMVVHVVTQASDFFAAMRQYSSFCREGLPDLLNEEKPAEEILAALFRIIHTFKGTFGQLGMRNSATKLHEMEGLLAQIRSETVFDLSREKLAERLSSFTPAVMEDWLEKDLTLLKDILGESFFLQEDMLVIENARLLEIEDKIQRLLTPGECRMLIPDLRRLRYKPVKELLKSYPEYICSLAGQMEKAVKPFEIEGGETLIDPLKYYDFAKSLGHVFRNALTHGQETFDERLEQGKDETGTIACTVLDQPEGLNIVIADDGRGIDVDRIRDIAVKKGICDRETAMAMPDEKAVQLIFADGFSGSEGVSELVGRGVGLSAVRAELEKLGGKFHVHTILGQGTEFHFFLPLPDLAASEPYSLNQLAQPLLAATEALLHTGAGLKIKDRAYMEEPAGNKLSLRKFTTFIGINGIASGKMVLSADHEVVIHLASKCLTQASGEVPADKWMENALTQCANEIFQSALHKLPNWAGAVTAEALVSILAEDASAKYPEANMPTWVLETNFGRVILSLIYTK